MVDNSNGQDHGPLDEGDFGTGEQPNVVEGQLAQYAFVREEREGEVRLLMREAPADGIARGFRAAGASLITLAGERARPLAQTSVVPEADAEGDHDTEDTSERRARRRHKAEGTQSPSQGEVTIRYFYAMGDLIYTVSVVIPTGIARSVASIYPSAALAERELRERLSVIFTS
jgi:hypothetical protein